MDDHRPIKGFGNQRFFIAAKVGPPVNLDSFLLQQLNCSTIADAWERFFHILQLADITLQRHQFSAAVRQYPLHYIFNKGFSQVHVAVEVAVRDLGLDHPEFGEMTTRLRFLCSESRAAAVDFAKGESP